MGVAGDEMNETAAQQGPGGVFGGAAELSGDGLGSDLGETALATQAFADVGGTLQDGVAFRMGDDGDDPAGGELAQDLIHRGGEKGLGEFDHEVASGVDGEIAVVDEGALDVDRKSTRLN